MPGGQAEYLRVPQAQFGPIKVPDGPPDERFLFLSDVLPTAWQAVEYADDPRRRQRRRLRARPDRADERPDRARTAARAVFGVDLVPERLEMARRHGIEAIDLDDARRRRRARSAELTDGRGPDSVIDAVGMEAHGAPLRRAARRRSPACCPDAVARGR